MTVAGIGGKICIRREGLNGQGEVEMTGKGLQAWREQYGYSAAELAVALRVGVGKIDLWERSKERIPVYLQVRLHTLEQKHDQEGAGQ